VNPASDDLEPATGPDPEPVPGPGATAEPAPAEGAVPMADAGRHQAPPPVAEITRVPPWAWLVLALFFAMHALETADVWVMASVLRRIKGELALEETEAGWLPTVLLVGAALAAPTAGYFIDRMRRPRLLAISFAVWSLAVVATGLTRSYDQIQAARAITGAGGATSTVIALTLLADLFPRRMRGRAIAAYLLAMPAGAVLGRLLAAVLPEIAGWPSAFLAAGAPGLALALLALFVPEPVRGASEPVDANRLRLHEKVGPSNEDYIDLMVNSSFNYSVFGVAFSSFALAGLVYWLPAFLAAKGMADDPARRMSIGLLLAAAATGTAAGGWLTDTFASTRPGRLFLFPGLAMFAAIGCVLAAIYGRSPGLVYAGVFLAEYAMFLLVVPCFTIIAGVTMPNMRGVGFGAVLAAWHILGDLWSPTLTGWVIDTFAQRDSMATGFGWFLSAIGAVPVALPGQDPQNLTAGLLAILPALLIAGVVLLAGIRHLPRELALMIAKLRAAPSRWR
jgi:MFS family permease